MEAHTVSPTDRAPVSTRPCDTARLQLQVEGLQACHWHSKTIHSSLWRLPSHSHQGNTRNILWALVACVTGPFPHTRKGPLTFREYNILNMGLLLKKCIKGGKQVTSVTNLDFFQVFSFFLHDPHTSFILHLETWVDSFHRIVVSEKKNQECSEARGFI